jgi:ABC-2 type transport system permease protein
MMRIRALVLRIARQFAHDKRTLALLMIAPLLILTLMWLVFDSADYQPKIGAAEVPQPIVAQLIKSGATVTTYTSSQANEALYKGDIDAVISFKDGMPQIELEGSDPSRNKAVLLLVQEVMQSQSSGTQTLKPVITYLHGSANMASFDNFGPVLIGFFCFFFVFIISGVAFLRERTGGTLERLLASPIRRYEIVVGYVIGFGMITFLQSTLIAWYTTQVLGILMVGSFGYLLLITLLISLVALTLGIFISAFAETEFQMIQFIPIIVVPQVFFSGLFSLDTMSDWLRQFSRIMPLRYGADAMRNIMIRGKGWEAIWQDALILSGFSVLFMLLNLLALRKQRKI